MKNFNKNKQGFTLLEILLVVAAIGILAGIVIFAINPAKQLADTRNAQRRVDVNTIANAIYQYSIDNKGEFPGVITNSAQEICRTTEVTCDGISLSVLTLDGKYLVAIPVDPSKGNESGTGYRILVNSNSRITVDAPIAEGDAAISVTR